MPPRKRGRGGVDDDGDDGGGADNTHADDDHASAAAPPHPLDMTPAGGGTAQAAAWGLTSAPSLRRQHALNAWAIMRAAASVGDAPAAASAAALALRAPAPPAEAGAALAGLPPGWAALAGARPEQAPPNPAALTGAGRATVLAVGLDALRTVAAAAAGRGQGGGVTRLDLTRAARARVAAAPPATPAGGAASLALALELASQGDTPQALAVLDAHAAAVAAKRAAAGGRGGGGGGGGGGGASTTAPLPTRPPDPATLAALAALRYATWEAGRRGDVSAGSAALAALTAAAGGGGGGGAGPAALAAALHLSSGGGGGAASAGSRPALDRATDVADVTLTYCPRDADAAALRLLLLAADPPGASNGQEQAGAALALLRCTPRSGRALGAVLASVVPAKAACAHIRAEAGALFLEASGGRPAAGSAPRSRAVRAAWVALAAGAGDLVAGLALSASSSSDGDEEEGGDAARDRPPPPSVSAPALAALRSRAAAWAEAGRPFDPSTLPGLRPQDPAVPASRLRLGAYALADRGVAGALVGGPGGAAFAAAVLGALDADMAVHGGDDDAPAAAARVRRALAEAERLEEALPPPWRLTVPHSGGAGPAAGPAPPAPRPQRTHPATGRLVDLPPSYFASFPPSLRRRAAG